MEMAKRAAPSFPPPLLVWRERSEIDRLAAERTALAERIVKLRPRAHYRVILEARLREMTARQIRLEASMKGGR